MLSTAAAAVVASSSHARLFNLSCVARVEFTCKLLAPEQLGSYCNSICSHLMNGIVIYPAVNQLNICHTSHSDCLEIRIFQLSVTLLHVTST